MSSRRQPSPSMRWRHFDSSRISEVVILGRRGPAHAAYTLSELLSLTRRPGCRGRRGSRRVVAGRSCSGQGWTPKPSSLSRLKVDLLRELGPVRASRRRGKRIVLRFGVSPVEFMGDTTVRAVRLERNALNPHERGSTVTSSSGHCETLECGLVLRSIGFRSKPIARSAVRRCAISRADHPWACHRSGHRGPADRRLRHGLGEAGT